MLNWIENTIVQQVMGLIRHALGTAGGALVAKGLMTNDQQQAIVGGVMAFLVVLWSLVQKRQVGAALSAVRISMMPQANAIGMMQQATVTNITTAQKQPVQDDLKGLY